MTKYCIGYNLVVIPTTFQQSVTIAVFFSDTKFTNTRIPSIYISTEQASKSPHKNIIFLPGTLFIC